MATVNSFKEYYAKIQDSLLNTQSDKQLFEEIVNAPFHNKYFSTLIDLGMIVLALADKKNKMVNRVAYSQTPAAQDAAKALKVKFTDIKIPLSDKENIVVKAIKQGKHFKTSDWRYLLTPVLSADSARFNQAESGMGCSVVYPLIDAREGGALIFSFYQPPDMIREEHHAFMQNYSEFVAHQLGQPN